MPTAEQEETCRWTWASAKAFLQENKDRLHQEISTYPGPIAGCDQQFNYLLEQRTAIRRELNRLLAAEQAIQAGDDQQLKLEEFVSSSQFLLAGG